MFAEGKRVLKEGGILVFIAPHAYLNEPQHPTLDEFVRVTAVHLLPELGIIEGTEATDLLMNMFGQAGAFQTFPGFAVFWAIKSS
jgi:hypothetical protein